jgi:hypothetical protein
MTVDSAQLAEISGVNVRVPSEEFQRVSTLGPEAVAENLGALVTDAERSAGGHLGLTGAQNTLLALQSMDWGNASPTAKATLIVYCLELIDRTAGDPMLGDADG